MVQSAVKPARALLAILGVIAALVIAALVVLLMRGEPAQLDEATPAGVVQRYTAAVVDGDESAAADYLSEAVRDACHRPERPTADNLTVTLVSTQERTQDAEVVVSIAYPTGSGPFGAPQSAYDDSFGLVKTGGSWRIESAPWQLAVCPNQGLAQ